MVVGPLLSIMAKPPWRVKSTFSDERKVQVRVCVIDLDPVDIGVQAALHRLNEDRGGESGVPERATLIQILGLEAGVAPIHQDYPRV